MAAKKKKSDFDIKIAEMRRHGAAILSEEEEEKLDPAIRAESRSRTEARLAQMSLPGALGLSDHLESKRWRYGLVDGHFQFTASFDKVHVAIPEVEEETYGDTGIFMSEKTKSRLQQESPRGIITSAGMQALDAMFGAGIQLGDMIEFCRGVVSRRIVATVGGVDVWSTRIYVGDITGCEETTERIRSGRLKINRADGKHTFTLNGKSLVSVEPFMKVEV